MLGNLIVCPEKQNLNTLFYSVCQFLGCEYSHHWYCKPPMAVAHKIPQYFNNQLGQASRSWLYRIMRENGHRRN